LVYTFAEVEGKIVTTTPFSIVTVLAAITAAVAELFSVTSETKSMIPPFGA
jgi:hypothetical protein